MFQDTTALERIEAMDARVNIIQGGARAGKTFAILIMLIDLSFEVKDRVITVVTDSYPNLEHGAIKDFTDILKGTRRDAYFKVNQVKHYWLNLCSGTKIEFLSCDGDDALGASRDYLFVNEANRIDYRTFDQLLLRTKERCWVDFNPINEFWVHTEVMRNRDDWKFIKLTYLDNEAIPENVLKDLLQHKGDGNNNWWRVYGLGEIGSLEGNVYSGWTPISEVPSDYVLRRYGVDFGFTNDPTAIVGVYENENGDIILDEKLCKTKVLTPELVQIIKKLPDGLCVCDNARPEIIAELQANGIRAIPCNKTAGEKLNGKRYNIELVQRRQIKYTSRSKELEREYLSYAWRKKKTGEYIDEPQDGNDHIMDAIAYAIRDMDRPKVEYGGVL